MKKQYSYHTIAASREECANNSYLAIIISKIMPSSFLFFGSLYSQSKAEIVWAHYFIRLCELQCTAQHSTLISIYAQLKLAEPILNWVRTFPCNANRLIKLIECETWRKARRPVARAWTRWNKHRLHVMLTFETTKVNYIRRSMRVAAIPHLSVAARRGSTNQPFTQTNSEKTRKFSQLESACYRSDQVPILCTHSTPAYIVDAQPA